MKFLLYSFVLFGESESKTETPSSPIAINWTHSVIRTGAVLSLEAASTNETISNIDDAKRVICPNQPIQVSLNAALFFNAIFNIQFYPDLFYFQYDLGKMHREMRKSSMLNTY